MLCNAYERPSLPIPWLDVLLILALVALNGVLAMSELAIVSSREARLKAMAKGGSRGAQCALDLAADPGRFLSTVQSGITLIAIFAGAFSGASLGEPVAQRMELLGLEPETAHTVGFGLVIVLTTYVSLVDRRDRPKQIALALARADCGGHVAADALACQDYRAVRLAARTASSALIFKAARPRQGIEEPGDRRGTAPGRRRSADRRRARGGRAGDDLRHRPARRPAGARSDDSAHRRRLDRRPRDAGARSAQALLETPHSRIPVADGSIDNIVGVIQTARRPRAQRSPASPLDLQALCRKAPVIPDLMDAMDALAVLRSADVPLALVHDEYGHLDGIVTPGSILAALAGTFAHDVEQGEEPPLVEREDGSWLVSGAASADLLVRPARRATCPTTAIIRPSPASRCRCSSICPRPARHSATTAGRSRSSTWTAARSTS